MSEDKTFRIDKFLWCIRAYKTRSLATDACNNDRVVVNDIVAKPARKVFIDDVVTYRTKAITKTFKIIAMPKSRLGAKLVADFIEDLTSPEEYERYEIYQQQQREMYRHGSIGRPTKKERRDLEKFRRKIQ